SSRFVSLSGLSGVFAGIFALGGAFLGWVALRDGFFHVPFDFRDTVREDDPLITQFFSALGVALLYRFLILIAVAVLFLSLLSAWWFAKQKAKKANMKLWDHTAKRMIINLMIPLVAGGIFCLALLWHGVIGMVAPATLIFYGLGLLNGSKYTLNEIRYLGLMEIALGLIALVFVGSGLVFWAIGFGVLHIIYGAFMYFKYDVNTKKGENE
ncbi:MAG TPA: hypothetical protein VL651_04820, partial [Bacteroidia bacterium]|nr:hypothetical protein [Bacteroidia bacterium]